MSQRLRTSVHEVDFSVEAPPQEAEFPIKDPGFDLRGCHVRNEANVLGAMITASSGNKYQGARLFISKFGDKGRTIADADDPEFVNYLVKTALNPLTVAELIAIDADQRGVGRKLTLGRYGWGMTAQLIEFLQKNPEHTSLIGSNFREHYLQLENDNDYSRDSKVIQVIKRGVVEKLAKTASSPDSQIRLPAQRLRSYIQPQIDFRSRILKGKLKDIIPQIVSMEKLLVENKLQTGTPGSFQVLSYELLARAVELEAQYPDNPRAKKMLKIFKSIEGSSVDEGPGGNFAPLITFLNVMQVATEYGLQDYELRTLKEDSPQSLPLAIDRIMHIVTVGPKEVKTQEPKLRIKLIRLLGHSARMFAEQAIKPPKDNKTPPLRLVDIQVRYPALPAARHAMLQVMSQQGKTSKEIHAEARRNPE